MKAWRVKWTKIDGSAAIVIAETRGKAIAKAVGSASEVWPGVRWQDFRCQRAPEYDAWAARQSVARLSACVAEEWVEAEATSSPKASA